MARIMLGWFSCLFIVAFGVHSSKLYVVAILGMTVTGLLFLSQRIERRSNGRS